MEVDGDQNKNNGPPGDANEAEGNDLPEAFPDIGFPIEPPKYPKPPEFNYRYRAGAGSTPQRRRVDFDRSIVLRSTKKDPHTGRVSQEDYDARENSEMQLSLGYVSH